MSEISLLPLTGDGEVRNLSGHERGKAARQMFELDRLDGTTAPVRVVVPEHVYTLTPSFFQGMFAKSVKKLGSREQFLNHYGFDASPIVLRQIESGIEASLMQRGSLLAI